MYCSNICLLWIALHSVTLLLRQVVSFVLFCLETSLSIWNLLQCLNTLGNDINSSNSKSLWNCLNMCTVFLRYTSSSWSDLSGDSPANSKNSLQDRYQIHELYLNCWFINRRVLSSTLYHLCDNLTSFTNWRYFFFTARVIQL